VFFGHYWLSEKPTLQARNALCLDYSAGTTDPLVTYQHEASAREAFEGGIRVHG